MPYWNSWWVNSKRLRELIFSRINLHVRGFKKLLTMLKLDFHQNRKLKLIDPL
ncbi:hypothetical protein REPUB_Repub05bG0032200 [Reevesia pubescens]